MGRNGDGQSPAASRGAIVVALAIAAIYPAVPAVWALLGGDLLVLQKVVSRWAMPPGLIFLLASFAAAIAIAQRQKSLALLAGAIAAIMLVATDFPTRWIAQTLEMQYPEWRPAENEPLDVVVVLGGGTGLTPGLRAQLGQGGERVGLAARLFEQGSVRQIVVTGDALADQEEYADSPREQGVELLSGFGVPDAAVETLTGRTTTDEIASLKQRPDLWKKKRCGLVTSALHLPRAMRLARRAGLDLVPIPADFRHANGGFSPLALIPSSGNLHLLSDSCHEFLGMLVGR